MIRKNEGYLWKIYKEVVSVKKRSVSWTRAFSKTFPSLSPSRKKKKTKPREYCYQKMITSLRCICRISIYTLLFLWIYWNYALCIITIFQRIVNRRRRKLKRLTVLSWSKDILQSSRALPPACTVIFLLSPSKWGPHLWSWWCWCLFRVLCASKM